MTTDHSDLRKDLVTALRLLVNHIALDGEDRADLSDAADMLERDGERLTMSDDRKAPERIALWTPTPGRWENAIWCAEGEAGYRTTVESEYGAFYIRADLAREANND